MNAASGEAGPPDAELVAGVLAGDREAFAAVYDRYGDRLYDFAHSMLRQREDAEDAVADSFVLVAERLGQLREPDRLRPWLYAIVRSECLRRLKARKRVAYGGEEQLVDMADTSMTPDAEAELSALRELVWDASAGLADRDRAMLDLHLRQGLEGAELGEAMGVSASNAYVMLNRLTRPGRAIARCPADRPAGTRRLRRSRRHPGRLGRTLLTAGPQAGGPPRRRLRRLLRPRAARWSAPWPCWPGVPLVAAPLSLRDRVVRHPAGRLHRADRWAEHPVHEATPQPGGRCRSRGGRDRGNGAALAGRGRRLRLRTVGRLRASTSIPEPTPTDTPTSADRTSSWPARSPSRPSSSTSAPTAPPHRCG